MFRRFSPEYSELMNQLNENYQMVKAIVLEKQNPVTGLLPASTAVTVHGDYRDAWVRDNVYSILCVWALALAYEKVDYDHGRTYELKHSVVKLMRGLLFAMMRQAHKVENFKKTQNLFDALHAKYSTQTCETVVADHEWGHLQLDATSLFLLTLAQMTASGLQIVFTLDEVNFVQNLVFYIERAYRTPDFGVWERGNKINNGQPELNSSSIGMVTAALEAIDGLDLFGSRGGPDSVIHVIPDEITKNYITLQSFLPRESDSKEVDAGVLAVIGFPAFAAGSREVVQKTQEEIKAKLEGPYGFARFLLDGHQNVLEDPNRLHYELHELRIFRGIECEWPLFFTYMILFHLFNGDLEEAKVYRRKLEATLITKTLQNGYKAKLVPELYFVPSDKIDEVRKDHNAMVRVANENVPLVWAQSLMIVGDLILNDLVTVGEIDPLGRRLRPLRERRDTLVQIALLSEDEHLQATLSHYGLETETFEQISPIKIHTSTTLSELYTELGKNKKLGLTGRPNRSIGTIGTCKIYRIQGQIHVFTPFFLESHKYYLTMDNDMIVEMFKDELQFVRNNWHLPGRPTMFILLTNNMLTSSNRKNLLNLMVSLKSGQCNDVRVRVGRTKELINTSWVDDLDFLASSASYQSLLQQGYRRVDGSSRLKFQQNHALLPSGGMGFAGRSERRVMTLQYLEKKMKEYESSIVAENQIIRRLSSEYNYGEPDIPNLAEIEAVVAKISVEECVTMLKDSNNLFIQVEILEYLVGRKGLDYKIEGFATLRELLEEVYYASARLHIWSVTRQAASLLQKDVEALSAAVVDLLIRQKQLTLGHEHEYVISAPHSPSSLHDVIYRFYSNDVREAALVQEIIFFLGCFVRAEPQIFEGTNRIGITPLLTALRMELISDEKITFEEASEKIFHQSPSSIKRLLHRILVIGEDEELNQMNADFNLLRKNGYPTFDPSVHTDDDLLNSIVSFSEDNIITKRKKIEICAKSGGLLDGNFGIVEIDGKAVFTMKGAGIGVVVIDPKTGNVLENSSFDTHSSVEDSRTLSDFITSQRNNYIIVAVVKSEASENLEAQAAFERIGSLRIRELGFRSSWAFIAAKNGCVEDLKLAKEGPVEDVKITIEIFNSTPLEFARPSAGKWRLRRQLDGGLHRLPPDFCPQVHDVLRRARKGLSIHGNDLPRNPTIDHLTPHERNFELTLQSWIDYLKNPVERQLHVECLTVVYDIMTSDLLASSDPKQVVKLNMVLNIGQIVDDAVKLAWQVAQPDLASKYEEYQQVARELFSDLPQNGIHGTLSFMKSAALKVLAAAPSTAQSPTVASQECQIS